MPNTAVDIENFTSLCDKPIGLLLQKEIKDGGKYAMNIVGFYEAETGKTATDILEKREAGALQTKIAALKDKVAKVVDDFSTQAPAKKSPADAFDDFEDDPLPF